jgi:hypothetical protein
MCQFGRASDTRESVPIVENMGAQITYKGKNHYLGFYATAREAAIAYNKAAIKFHGKFARINDIKGGE